MRYMVKELRYSTVKKPFVGKYDPYEHQWKTLELVRQAIAENKTICLINSSVTGSGKTLANFAAASLDGVPTIGVYPTNELLFDQHSSLVNSACLPSESLAILDSEGLELIQRRLLHIKSHAQALELATDDSNHLPVLLTNPDVLYLAMYNLYGQMFSDFARNFGARVFQNVLNNYPIIAFDEFHLYSPKQAANAAFIVGTAQQLAPNKPHVFIFSSATPQNLMNGYLERLGLTVEDVTAPTTEVGQVVCEPLEINFLAADLMRWKGVESLRDALPDILDWSDQQQPPAKGVFIVDSVYEAKKLAAELRQLYSPEVIGEVHGYMEPTARGGALKRRFSVGTTTIDVGVDLTGPNSKEFLAGESRSAAQAIQRIGRLGRRGREPGEITTPNRVWLVVPDYVYQYLQNHFPHEAPISRYDLFERLKQAYLGNENFQAYTEQYSHLEAVAASERILKQYFKDELPGNKIKLHTLVYKLYSTIPTTDTEEIEKVYNKWRRKQKAVWQKFGRQIKTNFAKNEQFFLSDLESFRGGLESDFSVVLYDELDVQQKMKPIKVYNLPFVLRRTECQELTQLQFQDLIRKNHPLQADEWLGELEQKEQRLGYFKVTGLINGPAIEVYFEIAKRKIEDYFEQNGSFRSIMRLSGFTINDGDSRFLQGKTSFHGKLQKLELNCWISEQKSFKLSQALHLPPLFTIYPLHARSIGGKYDDWSVAFGLDAFMMGSIRSRQMSRSKNAGGAYII